MKTAFIPITLRPKVQGSNFILLSQEELLNQFIELVENLLLHNINNHFARKKLVFKILKDASAVNHQLLDKIGIKDYLKALEQCFFK